LEPHESFFDAAWKDSQEAWANARMAVELAQEGVRRDGHLTGLADLHAIEARLRDIEEKVRDREALILHPTWGEG
jgi:hypothetical protein